MSKKLHLIATLFLGATLSLFAQAPELNWAAVQDGKGLEIGRTIQNTNDGNVVIMSEFNTKDAYQSTEYAVLNLADGSKAVEKTLYGAPDTFETNGNPNMAVYKVNTATGKLMWSINTNIGNYGEGCMTATPDNGIVLLLKMRHTSRGKMYKDTLCQFVDKDSTLTTIKFDFPTDYGQAPFVPVLVKIDETGKIEWTKVFEAKFGQWDVNGTAVNHTDNFDLGDIVADQDGYIYISGIYRTTLNFGKNAHFTNARNAADWNGDSQSKKGDLFIVKMDANGEAIWGTTTSGEAIQCEVPKGMAVNGDQLFVSGYMKGDGKATIKMGDIDIVPNALNSLFVTMLSTESGKFAWTKMIYSASNAGCDKPNIKPMGMSLEDNQIYLYGSFQGDIVDGEKVVLSSPLKKLNAYVLKCNAKDGTLQNGIHINNPTNKNAILEVEGCHAIGDKVYATGYDLFAESYLYSMDAQLSAESLKTYTVKQSGMGSSQASTFVGDKVINVTRLKNTAKLPGFDWTYTAVASGGNNNWACLYTCHTLKDITTGIETVTPESQHQVIYDLSGRRVSHPTQGLYIINGKKVWIR